MPSVDFTFMRFSTLPVTSNTSPCAIVADFAVPRWGNAEEMAELFAFCVSDRAGYLTGTDILVDGGVVASMRERARVAAQRA